MGATFVVSPESSGYGIGSFYLSFYRSDWSLRRHLVPNNDTVRADMPRHPSDVRPPPTQYWSRIFPSLSSQFCDKRLSIRYTMRPWQRSVLAYLVLWVEWSFPQPYVPLPIDCFLEASEYP